MRGAGVDFLRPADLGDRLRGAHEGAGRIDDVVEQDALLAFDVADDVHDFGLVGLLTALVHDRHVHAQLHRESAGAGGAAHVGRDDHDFLVVLSVLFDVMLGEEVRAHEVVHGDVEEALDLGGVEVHRQDTVGAGGGDEVRHQLGGDGIPALGLAVLPGIAEIGDHSGDASGGGAAHGVGHDQQLHQVIVDRVAGRLDNKDVLAANRFRHGDRALAVGELGNTGFTEPGIKLAADLFGQRRVGIAAENFYFLAVCDHVFFSSNNQSFCMHPYRERSQRYIVILPQFPALGKRKGRNSEEKSR